MTTNGISFPILPDYHVHTPYCNHAQGKIVDYVEAAIAKGMKELCFTDHLGRYYLTNLQKRRYWDWGMSNKNLSRYFAEIEDVAISYKDQIAIKAGLEVDYIEGAEELLTPIITNYPIDFLIGSIHCLPMFGWQHIAHYSRTDSDQLVREYFRVSKHAIESGLFSTFGHIDFIWRYTPWSDAFPDLLPDHIDECVKCAAHAATAIEINANGYLWSQNTKTEGFDPFKQLLISIARHGAPVTIGSDAHRPDCVGNAFYEIAIMLRAQGIGSYCTFVSGEKTEHPILSPLNCA